MPQQLGDRRAGTTVRFKWNTNAVAGESITRATNGSIRIYKNDSTTERTSSAGITDTEDFDGEVGVHHCSIDLADNTDAGFYAAGNDYDVVLADATIDGKAISHCLASFSIENREPQVDVKKISNDAAAADNAEAFFDGTGYAGTGNTIPTVTNVTNLVTANVTQFGGTAGTFALGRPEVKLGDVAMGGSSLVLTMKQVVVNNNSGIAFDIDGTTGGMTINATNGSALSATSTGGNGSGFSFVGHGFAAGLIGAGGDQGHGAHFIGGATVGFGMYCQGQAGNSPGGQFEGEGSGVGVRFLGGVSGHGAHFDGNGASSHGALFTRGGASGDDMAFANGDVTIPWNAAWDSEVQSEVADELEARGYTSAVSGRIDVATSSRAAPGAQMGITDGAITSAKFTVAAIAGVETGILEQIRQLWRRFFKKHVHDKSAKTIKTFADNGSTVLTTQSYTSDATTDDVGAAT